MNIYKNICHYYSERRRASALWHLNRLRSETNSRAVPEIVIERIPDEERSNSPSSSGINNNNNTDSNNSRSNSLPTVQNYRFGEALSRAISNFRSAFSQDNVESNTTATPAATATSTSTSTSTSARNPEGFDRIVGTRNNPPASSPGNLSSTNRTATDRIPDEDRNNEPPPPSLSSSAGNSRPESDDESQDDSLLLESFMRVRPAHLRSRIIRRRFRRRAERFYNALDPRRRETVSS